MLKKQWDERENINGKVVEIEKPVAGARIGFNYTHLMIQLYTAVGQLPVI